MWTREWPTEPGHYWFYGWTWLGKDYLGEMQTNKPKCSLVEVHNGKNKAVIRILRGQFMYASERHIGLWCPATLPQPDDNLMIQLLEEL